MPLLLPALERVLRVELSLVVGQHFKVLSGLLLK